MPDVGAQRQHPLSRHVAAPPAAAGPHATTSALPAASRFIVRGDAAAAATISTAFGAALSSEPMRASDQGARAALWLGPDEWLLLAEEAEGEALYASLTAALAGLSGCLVDVSHRQTAIEVRGPRVEDVLNTHVPLDLSAAAVPVGMSTRTLLAKAEVVLWRRETDAFRVEVARSLAPYVWDMLREAMLEYEVA
jgi:sarcosine oxidase subunit gamma